MQTNVYIRMNLVILGSFWNILDKNRFFELSREVFNVFIKLICSETGLNWLFSIKMILRAAVSILK